MYVLLYVTNLSKSVLTYTVKRLVDNYAMHYIKPIASTIEYSLTKRDVILQELLLLFKNISRKNDYNS